MKKITGPASKNVYRIGKPAKDYKCTTDSECEAEEAATMRQVGTDDREKALARRKRNRGK